MDGATATLLLIFLVLAILALLIFRSVIRWIARTAANAIDGRRK